MRVYGGLMGFFMGFTRPGKRLPNYMERSTMFIAGKIHYFYDHFQVRKL